MTRLDFDKQELADVFKEADDQVREEIGKGIVATAFSVGLTLTLLVKGVRRARAGNYNSALCYLIAWHSVKSSSNQAAIFHQVKK